MDGFFEIGEVVKPHGLNGEVKVKSFLVEPEASLAQVRDVVLTRHEEKRGPVSLLRWRRQKNFLIMALEASADVDMARELVGYTVWAREECLAPLPEGEFYWRELIGMRVVTEGGEEMGELTAIFPTGSNDVYVCSSLEGEILIPAIADCVVAVNKQERKMVVRIREGR